MVIRWFVWLAPFLVMALSNSEAEETKVGSLAPLFKLESFKTGEEVSFEKLLTEGTKRRVVVLSFFQVDCEACKKEFPFLQELYLKYQDQGVVIRLINIDPDGSKFLGKYVQENQIKIPILLDPYGLKAGKAYGALKYNRAVLPRLVVIGKEGKINKAVTGFHPEELKALADELAVLIEQKVEMKDTALTIVYTNSTNGYLDSCNCPGQPFGGLARRAAYFKRLRQEKENLVFLDSGDFFPPNQDQEQDPLKIKYCLAIMKKLGYDAVEIGDQELIPGVEFIKEEIEKNEIPFLCANLTYCGKDICMLPAQPYLIKEAGKHKVAVIGIISSQALALFPKEKLKRIKILDPIKVLNNYISLCKKEKGVDVIVVLSHAGLWEDERIAMEVKGIDIIVGGHSQTLLREPVEAGKTVILQAGPKGQYVGVFTPGLEGRKSTNKLVPLIKDMADDEEIRALIDTYYNERKKEKK